MTSDASVPLGITVLRVSLGARWIAHALLEWQVFTLPGTAQCFQSIAFAGVLACPVFAAERLDGIALVLGVCMRLVALGLAPVMAVAAWVHWLNSWVHTSGGGVRESPVFLIARSVALWLLGDGALAWRCSGRLVPRLGAA